MRSLPETSPLRVAAREVVAQIDALLEPVVPWYKRVTERGVHDYYEWYYAYGRILRPRSILEIGVLGGGSVVALCLGAGEGMVRQVHLVDDESASEKWKLADAATAVRAVAPACEVTIFAGADAGDSQRLAVLPAGPVFDVISIDADHRVGPCYHDLRISLPRLAADGHVLVDDAQWSWVRDAVDAFTADRPALDDLFVATKTGTRILHGSGEHLLRCPLLAEVV